MKALCYSEGKFSRLSDTTLPISDLGIQRGYGVFDFFRIQENKPLFLKDHLERFYRSAQNMRMRVEVESAELESIIMHLVEKNQYAHSGIRILLTGGDSEDGYSIEKPRISIQHQPLKPPPSTFSSKGIHVYSYPYQRQLPQVKTTDYIMAIWLQPWLKDKHGDEILYCNSESVLECPRSNIFMITSDHRLITPENNILKGVTRKQILHLADSVGLQIECRNISLEELISADEVFISSSTKRIVPVATINGNKIGNNSFRFSNLVWQALFEYEHTQS